MPEDCIPWNDNSLDLTNRKMGCNGNCFMCNSHENKGKDMEKIICNKKDFVRTVEDEWINLAHIKWIKTQLHINSGYRICLCDTNFNEYPIIENLPDSMTAIRMLDEWMRSMGNEKKSRKIPEKQPKKAKKTPLKQPKPPKDFGKVDSMIPASPFLGTKKKAKK